jgi:hypothetical protein
LSISFLRRILVYLSSIQRRTSDNLLRKRGHTCRYVALMNSGSATPRSAKARALRDR